MEDYWSPHSKDRRKRHTMYKNAPAKQVDSLEIHLHKRPKCHGNLIARAQHSAKFFFEISLQTLKYCTAAKSVSDSVHSKTEIKQTTDTSKTTKTRANDDLLSICILNYTRNNAFKVNIR